MVVLLEVSSPVCTVDTQDPSQSQSPGCSNFFHLTMLLGMQQDFFFYSLSQIFALTQSCISALQAD